ncbi:MAG: hypothetical protein DRJ42_21230 [Deltaproteobacteria bacterium]|nr:MAG: hypothetical protein DRJ42_21230 [Deltaproteobacteria bacterium]
MRARLDVYLCAQLTRPGADKRPDAPSRPESPLRPSPEHEALVVLFRNRPQLAAELLTGALGVALPEFTEARIASAELTEARPVPYRADLVVELRTAAGPVGAVIVEIQLGRDPGGNPAPPD